MGSGDPGRRWRHGALRGPVDFISSVKRSRWRVRGQSVTWFESRRTNITEIPFHKIRGMDVKSTV